MEAYLNDLLALSWIRPWALWLLLLVIPLVFFGWQSLKNRGQWEKAIDAHLLQFMLQQGDSSRSAWPLVGLALALVIGIIALAGPSFDKKPVPVYRTGDARVILLDLSLSMDAVDIKPSRLTRAKHKLTDILDASDEGETALIVYAGDAFIISPLTSDAKTIQTMVPVLTTGIMPVLGSEPFHAFAKAKELLQNAGKRDGQIIWITDGIEDIDVDNILDEIKGSNYSLSILTVATEEGAPIPLPNDQGFLKDDSGNIVMPTLNLTPLRKIANQHPTVITQITADNQDIQTLMAHRKSNIDKNSVNNDEKVKDQLDQGYWLLFPVLFISLFLFRKNARIPGLALLIATIIVPESQAGFWEDLWLTKDQQAQRALEQGQADKAAKLFENKDWQASAHYRAENYSKAKELFAQQDSATQLYNQGNALAHLQKFDQAIEAYEKALEKQPDFEDAQFNKELLEKLKQQQEQQNQEQQDSDKKQQQDEQQSDQENKQNQQEQNEQEKENEQQSQEQQQSEQEKQQKEMNLEDKREEQEKDQALEQWLRKIPDDPGGLLRRKMYREYKKRGRENRYTKKVW